MSKIRETQAYYSERAHAYRASKSHANPAELARMIAWLAPRPGAVAVDVATGGGNAARALAEVGCRVVATDVTREMLHDLARPALLCDAHQLPLRAGSVDIVASRIAPHHFTDLDRFVRETARALKPGGKLYAFDLTTPDDAHAARIINRVESLRDPSHVNSYSAATWTRAVERAGLTLDRLEETASEFELEPWIARAGMPREREDELRRLLAEHRFGGLGGYGVTSEGRMRVLRVELLARKP